MKHVAVLLFISLVAAGPAHAAVFYVDDNGPGDPGPGDPTISDPLEDGSTAHPFDAIQEGIDAAASGDSVVVLDGVYNGTGNEGLDLAGKPITVTSQNGPANCTINLSGSMYSGFVFQSGETGTSVVRGFTIRNDYPLIQKSAIECLSSSPTIADCVLTENKAFYGGGLYIEGGSPTVKDCTITANFAGARGGGIYCTDDAAPTFIGCTLTNNEVWGNGGALCCEHQSSPTLKNCTIAGNSAQLFGGGIYSQDSDPSLVNCMIYSNHAQDSGGAGRHMNGAPTYLNCTVASNTGGGLSCVNSATTVTNAILWYNQPESIVSTGFPAITVSSSDVEGGWPGPGNIDSAPLFVEQAGDDYHIRYTSPCRNAGDNGATGLPVVDFEGDPRVAEGTADMGADEFHTHLYCTGDFTPGGAITLKGTAYDTASEAGIFYSASVLDPPLPTGWGLWYLGSPYFGPILLGPVPADGVYVVPLTLPSTPGSYSIYVQTLVRYPMEDTLTNLYTIDVK